MDGISRRRELLATQKDPSIIYEAKNLTLTGTNRFSTGFAPFSAENINKDFELRFYVENVDMTIDRQYTIIGGKYEGTINGVSYPGFYCRRVTDSTTDTEVSGNGYWRMEKENMLDCEFFVNRIGGVWHYGNDKGMYSEFQVRSTVFDQELIIGAATRPNGTFFRYGKFTARYITVKYL